MARPICPTCKLPTCFACETGHCKILTDNQFTYKDGTAKPCPFFKTTGRIKRENSTLLRRFGK